MLTLSQKLHKPSFLQFNYSKWFNRKYCSKEWGLEKETKEYPRFSSEVSKLALARNKLNLSMKYWSMEAKIEYVIVPKNDQNII